MREKKKEEYRLTHDFTDVNYWHKRYMLALKFAIAGWVIAALSLGLLLAHLTDVL